MLHFNEIFAVMEELAQSGEQFFVDAVSEYKSADAKTKQNMRNWLEDEFADHDSSIMDIRTGLLLMMFPA